MGHVNKARQFTDLGMVHCELFSTRTDRRQIVQWPAVAKVDVSHGNQLLHAVLHNLNGGKCA